MDIAQRIQLIGKHMVEVVVANLKNGAYTVSRAKDASTYYVHVLHPTQTHQELDTKMENMLQIMPEMHVVVRSDKMRRTNT